LILILVAWIQIWIQEGKNDPKKLEKREDSSFEVLDALFCGLKASLVAWLDVLYGGLGISKLQFCIKKILIFFQL
jgi:hypothetical protein